MFCHELNDTASLLEAMYKIVHVLDDVLAGEVARDEFLVVDNHFKEFPGKPVIKVCIYSHRKESRTLWIGAKWRSRRVPAKQKPRLSRGPASGI